MKNVLFVCQANVGRSQMGEAFYNFHTGSKTASSAGVGDYREKYHHKPTMEIISTMMEKGIDISNQKISFLTPKMVMNADLIVVLCAKRLCPEFLIKAKNVVFKEVDDPHQRDQNSIRRIRDSIEQIVIEFTQQQS